MKNTIKMFAMFIMVAAFAVAASAQVTGNFKVTASTYENSGNADGGDVTISGTLNHGAIQSGKKVVVEVIYDYSFEYTITSTVNGVTTVTTPARCPNPNDSACKNKPDGHQFFFPTTENVPYSYDIVEEFDGSKGMTAITEPTVVGNKINPKGKIVGYKFTQPQSLIPSDSLVNLAADLPTGAALVSGSVQFTKVGFKAYLKDVDGSVIADTVVTGVLFDTAP